MRVLLPLLFSLATGLAQNTQDTPQNTPYELKGFTVGVSTLTEFKAKFHHCADVCTDKEQKKYKVAARFAPSCSDDNPDGVRPPATNADWTKDGFVFCQPYLFFEQSRGQSFTVAEIETTAYFDFFQGRLYHISAAFLNNGGSNFKSMLEPFTGKYGAPTSQENHEYQNAFGAKFTGLIVVWDNSASRIVMSEIGADRDTSAVEFTHAQLKKKAEAAEPKKTSKDL
jgi:hypothetical protein